MSATEAHNDNLRDELSAQLAERGWSGAVVDDWIQHISVKHETISVAEVLCNTLHDIDVRTHFIVIDIFTVMPDAIGDAVRLQQVLEAVIHSAMRYSPVDSTIRLAPFVDSETVGLTCRDEGRGMAAGALGHLLEPDFESEASGVVSGFDFDLFVAKSLIAVMGGQIEVESEIGYGTTVQVRLPRVACNAGERV